jgi:hypothetical protein
VGEAEEGKRGGLHALSSFGHEPLQLGLQIARRSSWLGGVFARCRLQSHTCETTQYESQQQWQERRQHKAAATME